MILVSQPVPPVTVTAAPSWTLCWPLAEVTVRRSWKLPSLGSTVNDTLLELLPIPPQVG